MKKNFLTIYIVLIELIFFSACIKEDNKTFQGEPVVEFDATPLNPATTPFNHPLLLQIPRSNIPVTLLTTTCSNAATVEPFIRRTSGSFTLRVNLVGRTENVSRDIDVVAFPVAAQLPSITFRQPSPCSNVTVTTADAVAGTHYNLAANKITIPADSSCGYVTINILYAGTTAGQARVLGLELKQASLKPSENYKRIAIAIDQR
ncbi:MAG TPA: hypothetical protein VNA26_00935 [Chitinophagaceae bacterium]|nr:hypothetical protein [Chitinophagaceae bacterium]